MALPPTGSRPVFKSPGWIETLHPRGYHGKFTLSPRERRLLQDHATGRLKRHLRTSSVIDSSHQRGAIQAASLGMHRSPPHKLRHGSYADLAARLAGAHVVPPNPLDASHEVRRSLSDPTGLSSQTNGALRTNVLKGGGPETQTAEPFSSSTTSNWVARVGGLPHYIQHIAHAIAEHGVAVSRAIATAIAAVKHWAAGQGHVNADTRAAAAKAVAEWEAKKAESHASIRKELEEVEKSGWTSALHPRGVGAQGGQFIASGGAGSTTQGKDVEAVQRLLKVKRTGKFDAHTAAMVRQYQKRHGLRVDGIVGAQTAGKLLGASSRAPGRLQSSDASNLRYAAGVGKVRKDDMTTADMGGAGQAATSIGQGRCPVCNARLTLRGSCRSNPRHSRRAVPPARSRPLELPSPR